MRRLVEAELPFDLGDEIGWQPLGAAIGAPLAGHAAAAARFPAAAAGDAGGGVDAGALDAGDHLLHRAARRELHDDEVDQDNPEQRQRDEQQAADDVGEHGAGAPLRRYWAGVGAAGVSPAAGTGFSSCAFCCSAATWRSLADSTHQAIRSMPRMGRASGKPNLSQ